MQAICGFIHLDGRPAAAGALTRLRAGLIYNPQAHTGRFAGGTFGNVALGTAAWGGQSAGGDEPPIALHQPTGCIAIADARLDERVALARALDLSGHEPASAAALILHAWLRWGETCAEHLRGDFAFAVWDPRVQRLYCARDIMGVRPLYIHHQPGKLFAFASRAQALLTLPEVPDDLDEGRIADVLVTQLEGIDKTSTFYRTVQRLPPAHATLVDADHIATRRYWQLEPDRVALPQGDNAWTEALTAVLETAVARHLDGVARVGSMVSGGMDSSSLAVIAADQLAAAGKGPLPTFSSLDTAANDVETRAVLDMAKLPGLRATLIEPATVLAHQDEFVRMIQDSDEPFDCLMLLIHAQYRAAATAGVDAVIDGGDADVLLLPGKAMARQLRHLHWIGFVRNFRGFHRTFPTDLALPHLNSLVRTAFVPEIVRTWRQRLRRPHHQGEMAGSLIAADFAQRVNVTARLDQLASWRPRTHVNDITHETLQRLDHHYTICGSEHYHRAAAWHGVDPRHPFMDRDVLEFAVNLPDRQRMRDGWMKAILYQAMRGRLPEPVRTRREKHHLGWSLNERVLLPDAATVHAELASLGHVLAPYVNIEQLGHAIRRWDNPTESHDKADKADIRMALGLGHWLLRHARQQSINQTRPAPDQTLPETSPQVMAPPSTSVCTERGNL